MNVSLVFAILTTISFVMMMITHKLRESCKEWKVRKNKRLLEFLTVIAFLISSLSLLGNWTRSGHFIQTSTL